VKPQREDVKCRYWHWTQEERGREGKGKLRYFLYLFLNAGKLNPREIGKDLEGKEKG